MSALLTGILLLALVVIAAALLYARGIAGSTGEPFWETVKSLAAQIVRGDFF